MNIAKLGFLSSPRFWQLAIVGVTAGLNEYSNNSDWSKALVVALGIWFGGSVVVRTVDRASEPKLPPADAELAAKQP